MQEAEGAFPAQDMPAERRRWREVGVVGAVGTRGGQSWAGSRCEPVMEGL